MTLHAHPTTTLFPLLLAALLAGLSYWLEVASRPPAERGGQLTHDPDYRIESLRLRRFDANGALQHSLDAANLTHYPDDDTTVVDAPRLILHREPPTRISAREARIDGKGERVELIDDVRVTRAAAAGRPDTVLTTAHLLAWPDDETALADAPVTIVQGRSQISGSALRIDNQAARYVLEGPVDGIFRREAQASAATPAPSHPITSTRPAR